MIADACPLAGTAELAESPLWDARTRRLMWIDMAGALFAMHDTGKVAKTVKDGYLAAIAPTDDGDVILVRRGWIERLLAPEPVTGNRPLIAEDLRFNDARCDPAGRLLVGTTRLDLTAGGGSVGRIESNGAFTILEAGLTLPNGIGWTGHGDRLFIADSARRAIFSGAYRLADGNLSPLKPAISITRGYPDGLCLCVDDSLWVALWDGGCVQRYSPDNRLLDEIALPVSRPTSCAVDEDGTLYITTAAHGLDAVAREREPMAGRILRVDRAGPPGLPISRVAMTDGGAAVSCRGEGGCPKHYRPISASMLL